MHPADRQAELKKHGYTQHRIATELNISDMSVHREIHNIASSERIRKKISSVIGKHRHEIFPSYYFSKKHLKKAAKQS